MAVTVVSISSLGSVELLVAAVAAVGAAVVVRLMRRAADVRVSGASGAPRAVAGLPLAAFRGLAVLAGAAAGRVRAPEAEAGRIRRIRLRDGADPGWAGIVLGWSADTCVTDLPEEGAEAVLHGFGAAPRGGPQRAVARRGGAR